MNPTNYTYNGVTVNYTDAQKNLVIAAQKTISDLQQQVRDIQNSYNGLEGQIQSAIAAVSESPYGACWSKNMFNKWIKDEGCYNSQNAFWQNGRAQQGVMQSQMDQINNVQLPQATKTLNDTITTIQNDIKLQIQAQESNSNAANLPSVIAGQNAASIEALHNQAAQDKLKQEQNIKMFGFFVVAIIVIGIVIVIIKKI